MTTTVTSSTIQGPSSTIQGLGGQAADSTVGVFYAYIHNIADDNTWRFTLIFASSDIADQWWRAVSTSTVAILQNNIQRVTPQFYTHNPNQWNVINFFIEPQIATLAAQFRGHLFLVLENDRAGRGISIIPTQTIVSSTSGRWFSIRSKANPSLYWYYDDAQGFIVTSNTQRTSFKISAPDLSDGTVMIGTDDITIIAQNHGYVTPQAANAAGGSLLGVTTAASQVAFRFKFSDLKNGLFVPNSVTSGAPVLYVPQGGAGAGWELAL